MSFFTTVFCFELVLYALFVNQPVALSGNTAAKLKTATQHCNNIYFYAGSSKTIEAMLKEMKKQLTQIQSDIDTLKGGNNTVKGMGIKLAGIENQLSLENVLYCI